MPSKTEAQHRFFEIIKHNPKIAKERGVDPKVADEFLNADKAAGKWQHPHKSTTHSQEGITKQLASFNVGGLTDKPTPAPADQTYEFKTFGF